VEFRTDRLGVLLEQLEESWTFSKQRLEGLSDAEYRWEPADGMWSIRPAGAAPSPDAFGPGAYVLDRDRSLDPFAPGPVSTIAWRLGHLTSAFAGRWEWTWGGRATEPEDMVDFSPTAGGAAQLLGDWVGRWLEDAVSLTDEQLEVPGFGQYPHGLDPQLPFIGILWWQNREFIHHMAEVAVLRDLYRVLD